MLYLMLTYMSVVAQFCASVVLCAVGARYLEPDGFRLVQIFLSVVAIFFLFDLSLVQRVVRYNSSKWRKKMNNVFPTIRKVHNPDFHLVGYHANILIKLASAAIALAVILFLAGYDNFAIYSIAATVGFSRVIQGIRSQYLLANHEFIKERSEKFIFWLVPALIAMSIFVYAGKSDFGLLALCACSYVYSVHVYRKCFKYRINWQGVSSDVKVLMAKHYGKALPEIIEYFSLNIPIIILFNYGTLLMVHKLDGNDLLVFGLLQTAFYGALAFTRNIFDRKRVILAQSVLNHGGPLFIGKIVTNGILSSIASCLIFLIVALISVNYSKADINGFVYLIVIYGISIVFEAYQFWFVLVAQQFGGYKFGRINWLSAAIYFAILYVAYQKLGIYSSIIAFFIAQASTVFWRNPLYVSRRLLEA